MGITLVARRTPRGSHEDVDSNIQCTSTCIVIRYCRISTACILRIVTSVIRYSSEKGGLSCSVRVYGSTAKRFCTRAVQKMGRRDCNYFYERDHASTRAVSSKKWFWSWKRLWKGRRREWEKRGRSLKVDTTKKGGGGGREDRRAFTFWLFSLLSLSSTVHDMVPRNRPTKGRARARGLYHQRAVYVQAILYS